MKIETLHNFSLRDVEAIAKTFGFQTEINPGNRPGPGIVLRYESILICVESEIGHDTGGSKKYFTKLIKRLQIKVDQDRKSQDLLFLIIITNTPRRLAEALSQFAEKFREIGFSKGELGRDIYIVPALLYRELIPAILVRILSSVTPAGALIVT